MIEKRIRISRIKLRTSFRKDPTPSKELISSISCFGQTNPVSVARLKNGRYLLKDGLLRIKALKALGKKTVKAYYHEADPVLSESKPRAQIDREELRAAVKALMARGFTVTKIAALICRSELYVRNLLREQL